MVERSVAETLGGSRDALYERRSALSRDLLGTAESEQGTTKSSRQSRVKRGGNPPRPVGARRRDWRTPELALGVCLVVGGALGAASLAGKGPEMTQVVAAAQNIPVGHRITADDLVAMEMNIEAARNFISAETAHEILGTSTVMAVAAGMPLAHSATSQMEPLAEGEVLAPLSVAAGDVPPTLRPGDVVMVALVPDPALSTQTSPEQFDEPASVWAIDPPSELQADYVVTLRTTEKFLLESVTAARAKLVIASQRSEVQDES